MQHPPTIASFSPSSVSRLAGERRPLRRGPHPALRATFPVRGEGFGQPGVSAPTAGTSSGASRHLPRVRGRLWAAAVGILRRLSKAWSVARFPRVGMLLRMTARGTHAIPNELRTPQFRMHPLAPEPGKDLHGEGESAIIQAAH